MIEINGVRHTYDRDPVLRDLTLQLPQGQLTSLVGPNGAGKSTLLSVMARLLTPDTGQVLVDGLDVASTPGAEVARRLAVLRQENRVAARLTVADLVRFGRFPHGRGRLGGQDHRLVDDALDYVELGPLRERYLDQLSGGQRQRAYLAMVLAQGTDYVLLDEPLNSLDMRHAAATMALLRRAADDLGRTVVLVLHDLNMASAHSDHVVAMREGEVVAQGPPSQIMDSAVLRRVFDVDMSVAAVNGHLIGLHWRAATAAPDPKHDHDHDHDHDHEASA
ncbi:MAG: ATP-binding cassette domain-containing protein [Ornithinimicrobium sp.]